MRALRSQVRQGNECSLVWLYQTRDSWSAVRLQCWRECRCASPRTTTGVEQTAVDIALAHCGKVILESSRLESRRCETHYSCALRPPCRRPLPLLQVQCMGERAVGVGGGGGGGGGGERGL